MHNVDHLRAFDWGLFNANGLVASYVPAQLVGQETKNALQFDLGEADLEPPGFAPGGGSTFTGMADSFGSFGYLGCLKFFLISMVLRRTLEKAKTGCLSAQAVYLLAITPALHAITHSTNNFVAFWPHCWAFLIPALAWARQRDSSQRRAAFGRRSTGVDS
jgi:hypothetical protein